MPPDLLVEPYSSAQSFKRKHIGEEAWGCLTVRAYQFTVDQLTYIHAGVWPFDKHIFDELSLGKVLVNVPFHYLFI